MGPRISYSFPCLTVRYTEERCGLFRMRSGEAGLGRKYILCCAITKNTFAGSHFVFHRRCEIFSTILVPATDDVAAHFGASAVLILVGGDVNEGLIKLPDISVRSNCFGFQSHAPSLPCVPKQMPHTCPTKRRDTPRLPPVLRVQVKYYCSVLLCTQETMTCARLALAHRALHD